VVVREKYIEERYPRWFVFGNGPAGIKDVDISDGTVDVATRVSKETAEQLITAHNNTIDALIRLAQAFDAADEAAFSVPRSGYR